MMCYNTLFVWLCVLVVC